MNRLGHSSTPAPQSGPLPPPADSPALSGLQASLPLLGLFCSVRPNLSTIYFSTGLEPSTGCLVSK